MDHQTLSLLEDVRQGNLDAPQSLAEEAALREKFFALQAILRQMRSVLVAYSGGVDSTLVAWVAHQVLGERMLAVTAASPVELPGEVERAARLAQEAGFPHCWVEIDDLQDPQFVANPAERCYYCKRRRFLALGDIAARHGLEWLADGTNADDSGDYRPGLRALEEVGVRSPLSEANLVKAEVRALARALGLPNWDKPAAPCLATRIPYGIPVTLERVQQIGQAETFLHSLGFGVVRVRWHSSLARIEVLPADFHRLLEHGPEIVSRFKQLGFAYVSLDLTGYRSGSLNQVLPLPAKPAAPNQ
jgi:uncharacterized protein